MRTYLIIGVRNGGYNKTDNWPWYRTTNETKAKKALQYISQQEPGYEWSIKVRDVSRQRL